MNKCHECSQEFKSISNFCRHINLNHQGAKNYYDKWIGVSHCKICGEEAKFRNFSHGYNNVCDKKECLYKFKADNLHRGMKRKYGGYSMQIKSIRDKTKKTNLKKYGSECSLKNKKVRDKMKKTNLERYGVECVLKNTKIKEKIKETNLKKYGHEYVFKNKEILEKSKNSMIKKYGGYTFQSKILSDKVKNTLFEKYGVEYAQQDTEIHKKQQVSACKLKYFNDDIYYRGNFELDFLKKYYDLIDIKNGPSLRYNYQNYLKVYHSDFLIPSLNLIIEIKNSYLASRDKDKLEMKKKSCLKSGYNFLMIINKNYNELNHILNSL